MAEGRPNVLFLVWDACRYDYASEHASTLVDLAADNLWFERAIAPAPWSLPSHMSLFTGEYPHEHGVARLGDSMAGVTLAERLGERGYTCYGVSANGFACQRTGFHRGFDEYYYTRGRERYHDGLNVSGYALEQLNGAEGDRVGPALRTLGAALTHAHPLKSLVNLASVGVGAAAVRSALLQRIPHPLFASDSGYSYDPDLNTERLVDVFEREAATEGPFFAFANYMDTHRPYRPDAERQRRHLGTVLDRAEIERLNDEVAAPWPFVAADSRGEIDEEDLDAVRGLYAGEVETVDDHLARLLAALEATGQRENTLIVVTSDHGENLGEADELGRRRMGHEASVSDAVARVPLVIAHPEFEPARIPDPFSLVALYDPLIESASGRLHRPTPETKTPAACQYPPAGGRPLREKHPDVPADVLDHRIDEASVVLYGGDWRVGLETTGDRWAVNRDTVRPYQDAPAELRAACEARLDDLRRFDRDDQLREDDVSQLEALGYL